MLHPPEGLGPQIVWVQGEPYWAPPGPLGLYEDPFIHVLANYQVGCAPRNAGNPLHFRGRELVTWVLCKGFENSNAGNVAEEVRVGAHDPY